MTLKKQFLNLFIKSIPTKLIYKYYDIFPKQREKLLTEFAIAKHVFDNPNPLLYKGKPFNGTLTAYDHIFHFFNGQFHCSIAPAVVLADGTMEYWKEGKRHNLTGPAILTGMGIKQWWIDGQRHRDNGPAVIWQDGQTEWWEKGLRHRKNGPAVVKANGEQEFWLNGQEVNKMEFFAFTKVDALGNA